MKATIGVSALVVGSCGAFQVPLPLSGAVRSTSSMSMMVKSQSIPFMERPSKLDGSPGDAGFDPLNLSGIDFDFGRLIVPDSASMKAGEVDALYWMKEAEIKHCRTAMLATLGWVAVDMGLRFPGAKYAGLTAATAHDPMVASGNLPFLFMLVGGLELIQGCAIYQASRGSGRKPGVFGFDPLNLGKDPTKNLRFQENEIQNGRLAMLAFSGICTQAVLTGHTFPYLF